MNSLCIKMPPAFSSLSHRHCRNKIPSDLSRAEKEKSSGRGSKCGEQGWLSGRACDRKVSGFESRQERRENFLLRGQLSVLTLYLGIYQLNPRVTAVARKH